MTRPLDSRAELRALLAIALPLAGAYLAEHAIVFTDRVIVGRLGSLELAAVGLAGMLLFDLLFASMGVLTIVGVMVAQAVALGDRASASRAVRQGFWVATALSAPVMVACWLLAPLLGVTGQDPRVVPLAAAYLHAVVWAVPPTLWFAVLRNFVTALARTRVVLIVVLATIGLNALLNYALVFGRLGAPALGVAGAGYGTAIVSWGMFAALALYAVRAAGLRGFRVHRGLLRLEPVRLREIVRLGLPVAGANVLESGMFTMVAVLAGVIGAAVLAAHQIVVSFIAMGIVVAFAIGEAATVRVARWVAVGSHAEARRSGYLALAVGLAVMVGMAALLLAIPEAIVAVFVDVSDPRNQGMLRVAVTLFAIAALFQLVDGTQAVMARALRGTRDTAAPLAFAAVGYWAIGVAGGALLAFPLGLGGVGLWLGIAAGLATTAVLLLRRFHARTRPTSETTDPGTCPEIA